MKSWFISALFIVSSMIYADDNGLAAHGAKAQDPPEPAADYIATQAYIQNPYIGMPSGGGTQNVSESQLETHNVAEKWFADGTYNVFNAASYVNQAGAHNLGYAANIFAQTGQVAGFSFGGFLTIANPLFSSSLEPSQPGLQAQGLPINEQITPQELFAQYQYSNIVQADIGWIGVNNSPWLTFYQNNTLNLMTYQGAMVNVHPGGGWLLSGLAFNAGQRLGETGFSQQTLYNVNQTYNVGGLPSVGANGSSGTIALGANWSTQSNDYSFRVWGYQFNNYANLGYADTTLKLDVNKDLGFILGLQGGIEGGNGEGNNNVFNNAQIGGVNSNFIGAQLGFNYNIFSLQLGYNNIWGGNNAYAGGGIVSPYTYGLTTDPLYTTGWLLGMVERSAGSAYKIAPSLNLLDKNLQIGSSYENFSTTAEPASYEYDIQVSYSIPQIKGFTIFGGYGYLFQSGQLGGNTYQGQLMVSYIY